jgi:hypothetical protein
MRKEELLWLEKSKTLRLVYSFCGEWDFFIMYFFHCENRCMDHFFLLLFTTAAAILPIGECYSVVENKMLDPNYDPLSHISASSSAAAVGRDAVLGNLLVPPAPGFPIIWSFSPEWCLKVFSSGSVYYRFAGLRFGRNAFRLCYG